MAGLTSLNDLLGTWTLARLIVHGDGSEHRFNGQAVIARDAEGAVLSEEGVLTGAPGQPEMAATRRYLLREETGGLVLLFDDGRPFHRIPFHEVLPEADHDCPPDLYRVRYNLADLARWQAHWRVTGPRKNYEMTSRYSRSCPA